MKNSSEEILAMREGYEASVAERTRECAIWGSSFDEETGLVTMSVNGETGDFFAWTSYTSLRSLIESALENDAIREILVCINSPGGEVSGLFECTDYIREAKKCKPIHAHVTGQACSAAYALACACTDIYATETSEVGSIGVMASATDYSEYQKKNGILSRIFRSRNAERKNASPFSEEGARDIQAKIDFLEDKFYDLVSESRCKDKEKCIEEFGHGAVFLASEALERGMIDGLCQWSEFYERFASSADEEEGEDMDITKWSAEDKTSVFNALVEDNPSLLAAAMQEAEEKLSRENERVATLEANRNDCNGAIIDAAIADGRCLGDIALELYQAEKERNAKLAEAPLDLVARTAEGTQVVDVVNPTADDLKSKADAIAMAVAAARE